MSLAVLSIGTVVPGTTVGQPDALRVARALCCRTAEHETWLLVVGGSAHASSFDVTTGDAIFAQSDRVNIIAGSDGFAGLIAYTGRMDPQLLKCVDMETTQ